MIVTIDGPAGAGKSSVAAALAQRLGFDFLDTGAMYRAVALAAIERAVPWTDAQALADLARGISLRLAGGRVFLNDRDVTEAIRNAAVTSAIHFVADNRDIREHLVELQRQVAGGRDVVTEGRDQGTVAFPSAECKIYLTAGAEERARRRVQQDLERGQVTDQAVVLQQIRERDRRDESRPFGRLMKAAEAVEVVTDGMTLTEVVECLERVVRHRQGAPNRRR
jgi:cytidylate kinase/pantoate ligase/cytidylate kinase